MSKVILSLDIETTGKRAGCRILSIGAITLDRDGLRTDGGFYEKISRYGWQSQFHDDPGTMKWWDEQETAAKNEAFSGVLGPHLVMVMWEQYIARIKPDLIYAKGASFDFPILVHAFEEYGFSQDKMLPYRALRCMRGLPALAGVTEGEVKGVAHNALDDARHQGMLIHQCITKLGAWDRI